MRILAASPYYPPEGGGLERYAHGILSRLAASGHDVEAFCYTAAHRDGGADVGGGGTAIRDGVRVHRLQPRLVAGNTPIGFGFASHLRAAMRRRRPDVVVVHTPVPSPAQAAARAARQAGIPYVVTYHAGRLRGSSPLLDAAATLDRWTLERRMLAGAAALIAVGPYVRDQALGRHRGRTTIVPPGVDARHFAPAPTPPSHRATSTADGLMAPPPGPNGVQEVLFVGPLAESYRWKGIDVLWDAFRLVRQEVPARLRFVGAGDRLDEFRRKAKALPARDVVFTGRVPDERLPAFYANAAVTVLPSVTDAESFGMVLAEANACGRPVVASRIGGIPDFVRHGDNGLLATAGDPEDLARRILDILEDPDAAQAMGRRGRERVLREHDWGLLAARTETILEDVVGDGRGTARGTEVPNAMESV